MIDVQLVGYLVAREENIGFLVAVEVAHADAPAVVDVLVVEDVKGIVVGDGVGKRNARVGRVEPLEQGFLFTTAEYKSKSGHNQVGAERSGTFHE